MDVPITEAAEMESGEPGEQRIMKLLSEVIQSDSKIVAGPVEDVPVYVRDFWLIGYTKDGLYYLVSSLREESPDPTALRHDLVHRIEQLPEKPVNVLKIEADLLAHQVVGKEVCAALVVADRKADQVEITVVFFSFNLSLEEASYLLRQTAEMSRKKHGD